MSLSRLRSPVYHSRNVTKLLHPASIRTTPFLPVLTKRQKSTTSQEGLPPLKPPAPPVISESIHGRQREYFCSDKGGPLTWKWTRANNADASVGWTEGPVGRVSAWLRAMFLPVGYPESVHPTYARVHFWQFFETLIGSTVSVLCSQAMLASVGVGPAAAAGGAVAIQWVLKDGLGEIGKLFFIQRFASSFDSHPKTWKLVGEISSLSGSIFQLSTVLASPAMFLPLASAGYGLRGIHFSIWGATHMTFTRSFALKGNVGDLVAKDDSQMSVAHLMGMLIGVGVISISHAPAFLFSIFAVLGPIHCAMTVALIRAARFEVLNQTQLTLLSRAFVREGKVPSLEELKPHERFFGEWLNSTEDVPTLKLGLPVTQAFNDGGDLALALDVLRNENYLLSPQPATRSIAILPHKDAKAYDIIKSILHAIRLDKELRENPELPRNSDALREAFTSSREWTEANFPKFIVELDDKDWQSDVVFWGDAGNRIEWERGKKEDDAARMVEDD